MTTNKPQLGRREFMVAGTCTMVAASTWARNTSAAFASSTPITAGQNLINSLDESQKKQIQVDFADKRRVDWHFIPMETRKGVPLRDMTADQRTAAFELLRHLLSDSGYKRSLDIMSYEAILLELEGPSQAKRRDYQKFYFTIFGNPAEKSVWGVSVEGHHLSLNVTFDGNAIVDSTPQFFGVNPAELRRDFTVPDPTKQGHTVVVKKGTRLLLEEEDSGFELLNSLTAEQKATAIYSAECPDDIQWAGEPQPTPAPYVGIATSKLNAEQKAKLNKLVQSFLANMPADVVAQRRKLIQDAGVDQIHFGWAGATEKGKQHFFRIHGPTFIAELCNFQTDPEGTIANHIHSVWRDMTGDFNLPIAAK